MGKGVASIVMMHNDFAFPLLLFWVSVCIGGGQGQEASVRKMMIMTFYITP